MHDDDGDDDDDENSNSIIDVAVEHVELFVIFIRKKQEPAKRPTFGNGTQAFDDSDHFRAGTDILDQTLARGQPFSALLLWFHMLHTVFSQRFYREKSRL